MQYRCSSDSYYGYRLYDLARYGAAQGFLELPEMIAVRGWLYKQLGIDSEDLADKWRFTSVQSPLVSQPRPSSLP